MSEGDELRRLVAAGDSEAEMLLDELLQMERLVEFDALEREARRVESGLPWDPSEAESEGAGEEWIRVAEMWRETGQIFDELDALERAAAFGALETYEMYELMERRERHGDVDERLFRVLFKEYSDLLGEVRRANLKIHPSDERATPATIENARAEVARLMPRYQRAARRVVSALIDTGNLGAAEEMLRRRDLPASALRVARILVHQSRYIEAMETLADQADRRSGARDSFRATLFRQAGMYAIEFGSPLRALSYFEQAFEIDRAPRPEHMNLLLDADRMYDAFALCTTPTHLGQLAAVFAERGDLSSSLDAFRSALLELNPGQVPGRIRVPYNRYEGLSDDERHVVDVRRLAFRTAARVRSNPALAASIVGLAADFAAAVERDAALNNETSSLLGLSEAALHWRAGDYVQAARTFQHATISLSRDGDDQTHRDLIRAAARQLAGQMVVAASQFPGQARQLRGAAGEIYRAAASTTFDVDLFNDAATQFAWAQRTQEETGVRLAARGAATIETEPREAPAAPALVLPGFESDALPFDSSTLTLMELSLSGDTIPTVPVPSARELSALPVNRVAGLGL